MVNIADLRLDKTEAPHATAARPGRPARFVPAAIVLIILAVPAAYLLWPHRSSPASVRVQTQQVTPRTHPEPVAEPGADITLPPLDATDPLVRQLVSALSSHPTVTAWLTTDHLIQNFTLVTLTIAEGRSPAKQLTVIKPVGAFRAGVDGTTEYIDPASYQRYDRYADAIASVDARGAARLYATLKPRITEAYRQLGDPDGEFDPTLRRAIVELLRTPTVDGRVVLARKSVNYTFADPALESLSGAQRQFLRMGPRNVRLIQQKLREIAPYLGIDLARSGT
jgi:Protein of unknown function (DUF3014)